MQLRPYQAAAVDSVFDYFNSGNPGHPVIVAPTGVGKSIMIAELIRRVLVDYPTSRVMVLAHVAELLTQNVDKLLRIWPNAPVGLYSAGLGYADTESPILYCGIQSVFSKAKILANYDRPIELVFIDEAHRVPLNHGGTYRRFISDLMEMNPYMRLIGLTATPFRYMPGTKQMTGGYESLVKGDDRLFTDICCDLSKQLVPMIHDNYLAALWPQPTKYQVDLSGVKIEKGDYRDDQLNALMSRDDVLDPLLTEAVKLATDDSRKHWLVFCAGVDQAHLTVEWLTAKGIPAAAITGATSKKNRAQFIADFKEGYLTALVSVGVLTTGFDAPNTDCLIVARPTISPILYVQMMGRGSRPTPDKTAIEGDRKRGCLCLDFCGNTERHGPIDQLSLKAPKLKIPKADRKECPECHAEISRFAAVCPECGHEFPAEDQPIELPKAGNHAIIAGITPLAPPVRYPVSNILYSRHVGKSGIPTLRVDYFSGFLRVASEWVCVEHTGYARQKAEKWWLDRDIADTFIPKTVEDALVMDVDGFITDRTYVLIKPAAIHVRPAANSSGYPDIVKYEWAEAE